MYQEIFDERKDETKKVVKMLKLYKNTGIYEPYVDFDGLTLTGITYSMDNLMYNYENDINKSIRNFKSREYIIMKRDNIKDEIILKFIRSVSDHICSYLFSPLPNAIQDVPPRKFTSSMVTCHSFRNFAQC